VTKEAAAIAKITAQNETAVFKKTLLELVEFGVVQDLA
jgi:hypothetical protein